MLPAGALAPGAPDPDQEAPDQDAPAWDPRTDDLIDEDDPIAENDEWAFIEADRLVAKLPQQEGKDRRTEGEVFDRSTLMTLHRMLRNGVLASLDFPVSTGKEANVFRGTTPGGGYVAVKIFRTNTSTFKHVLQYIQGDERFEGVTGDKKALVHAWAQKEFRNLARMRDAGVDVPEPIMVLQNVLVMEYVGIEEGAWPTLKEVGRLDRETAQRFWDKLSHDYVLLATKANLIHADASEYNVLVEGKDLATAVPRFIDTGQAVLRSHPMAEEFLHRDVRNLAAYFRRQRIDAHEAMVLDLIPELDARDAPKEEE